MMEISFFFHSNGYLTQQITPRLQCFHIVKVNFSLTSQSRASLQRGRAPGMCEWGCLFHQVIQGSRLLPRENRMVLQDLLICSQLRGEETKHEVMEQCFLRVRPFSRIPLTRTRFTAHLILKEFEPRRKRKQESVNI